MIKFQIFQTDGNKKKFLSEAKEHYFYKLRNSQYDQKKKIKTNENPRIHCTELRIVGGRLSKPPRSSILEY